VADRVALLHPRSIGRAVQGDLVDAEGLADGVDVVGRVARRVEVSRRAELIGAGGHGGGRVVAALERRARDRGRSGAALGERDQVAIAQGDPEARRGAHGHERVRLPRAARQVDERRAP
jgi:hypothetical protein